MNAREAKNFLVQQIVRQAAIENVPFSDLETRMLYFTENGAMSENPIELNSAFEAEHDNAAYEQKVSGLMKGAYRRLKCEDLSGKENGIANSLP